MSKKQKAIFGQRFLDSYVGHLMRDQKSAIMELIANSWDAGATIVKIQWPTFQKLNFKIEDNGHGLTSSQFNKRWRTLSYNRILEQGQYAEWPVDSKIKNSTRIVFGRNGKGRFAGFAFGKEYFVRTWRGGKVNTFKVSINLSHELIFQKIGDEEDKNGSGTEIFIENPIPATTSEDGIRSEIGMRFLTDPNFEVYVNSVKVTFSDIPESNLMEEEIPIKGVGKIKIIGIDIKGTDRTTHQHGVAWHVNRRLVGECTWKGSGHDHLIDGRRIAAKRYSFIIEADCLKDLVLPDWSGFDIKDEKYEKVFEVVKEKIKEVLLGLTKSSRKRTYQKIKNKNKDVLKELSLVTQVSVLNSKLI